MSNKLNIIEHEILPDIKIVSNFFADDNRGSFTKVYNDELFSQLGVNTEVREIFYSNSNKNVIRGMHYQDEPFPQDKLVSVLRGSVEDVIVDIRKNSATFGKVISIELKAEEPLSIFIPKGFAHGFKALEDNTLMLYNVSCGYNRESDKGIRWNSIDYDWKIKEPIMSDRDKSFIGLNDL